MSFLGAAFAGSLLGFSTAEMNTGNWGSAGFGSGASSSIQETILPDWAAWNYRYGDVLGGFSKLTFDFTFQVTGDVETIAGGDAVPDAQASISYRFGIGDAGGSGSKTRSGDGGVIENGPWGEVPASFTIFANQDFDLYLAMDVGATVGKGYIPNGVALCYASADFMHTFEWHGITAS
jgi:hypothetical protein